MFFLPLVSCLFALGFLWLVVEWVQWGEDLENCFSPSSFLLTASVVLRLVPGHHAGYPPKHGRSTQRGGDVVPVAVRLDHEDADLERAVDLAVLHEVAPGDAVQDLMLVAGQLGRRRRADADAVAPLPDMVMARAAAVVEADGAGRAAVSSGEGLALLDVLAQVQSDDAEGDLLGEGKLLEDLELDGVLGQVVGAVDRDAHLGYVLAEAVVHAVVDDAAFGGAAAVVGVHGVREVPLDVGLARDQGHIVEIIDLIADVTMCVSTNHVQQK